MPDLSTFATQKDLARVLKKLDPDRSVATDTWSLWAFSHLIKVGDYVVMPMKYNDSSQFSIGRVTGDYKFMPGRKHGAIHTRTVKWLKTYQLRGKLDSELRRKVTGRTTVFGIYADHAAERLLAAVGVSEETQASPGQPS